MKLFLDSADIDEIRELARWRIFDGITTTPTFFRRLGIKDPESVIRTVADIFSGEIHVEALGADADEIVASARRNRDLGPSVVSKIPIGPAGIEAASRLEEEGIAVNLHLVFTLGQAMMAAKANATYVCPLMGRMNDASIDAVETISAMVQALGLHPELPTKVMVSSIRSHEDARRAMLTGAKAVTIPGYVLRQMLHSPMTDRAVRILADDQVRNSSVARQMRGLSSLPVLRPAAAVSEALVEMTLKGIGIAAVVDEGKRVVGVVTDGDVRRALTKTLDNREAAVSTIMTCNPKFVEPEAPVERAVALMRKHRVGQVLVLGPDDGLLGFLGLHDLMIAGPDDRSG